MSCESGVNYHCSRQLSMSYLASVSRHRRSRKSWRNSMMRYSRSNKRTLPRSGVARWLAGGGNMRRYRNNKNNTPHRSAKSNANCSIHHKDLRQMAVLVEVVASRTKMVGTHCKQYLVAANATKIRITVITSIIVHRRWLAIRSRFRFLIILMRVAIFNKVLITNLKVHRVFLHRHRHRRNRFAQILL